MLPAIPLIDARSDALTTADPAAVRARDTICGSFKPIAVRALPLADRIARRWLARSRSPYLTELDAIAAHTRTAGTYAINLSYEYGCTTLARADTPGLAPTLRRTLDWPFRGLGRAVIVAHRCGPAGEFFDVTWPGAVGTLTAVAPGRFAAAINQAPLFRRSQAEILRTVDYTRNLMRTLSRERGMPLHLLRHVSSRRLPRSRKLWICSRRLSLPAPCYSHSLRESDEIAVIERRERDATVYLGAAPWRTTGADHRSGGRHARARWKTAGWIVSPGALHRTRCVEFTGALQLGRSAGSAIGTLEWRSMNAGEGWIRALGPGAVQ